MSPSTEIMLNDRSVAARSSPSSAVRDIGALVTTKIEHEIGIAFGQRPHPKGLGFRIELSAHGAGLRLRDRLDAQRLKLKGDVARRRKRPLLGHAAVGLRGRPPLRPFLRAAARFASLRDVPPILPSSLIQVRVPKTPSIKPGM